MTDIPEAVIRTAILIYEERGRLEKAWRPWADLPEDAREVWIRCAAAILADREARKAEPVAWRCFHCDAAFTENEKHAARLHFGCDDGSTPACQIKAGAEHSMLEALRRAEQDAADAIHKMHDESSEGWRAYHHVQSRLREQVTAAEELGYERGLHDNATIARLEQEKAELLEGMKHIANLKMRNVTFPGCVDPTEIAAALIAKHGGGE